ncbi:MAG: ABC transporter permease [Mycoplasmoidaceae bacterium]
MSNTNKFDLKSFGLSLVYNEKNRASYRKIFFIILLILISLFVSLLIIQMIGYNMGEALGSLFVKPFQELFVKDFMTNISILGLSALAFTASYKAGVFNIGVSGQMMAAGLAVVSLGQIKSLQDAGEGAIILVVLVAMLTGMFVSLIAGVLKTFLKVHEVVTTILLNWIIFFLMKYLITLGPLGNPLDSLNSLTIPDHLAFYDPSILSGFVGGIVSLILVALALWAILKYTVYGKQVISVGQSLTASHYAGYNIKLLQLSSFAITGAISGLLACVVYTANATKAIPVPLVNLVPPEGFNGIAIALIAFANPIAILPVAFIMGMFITGSVAAAPFPNSMGSLIIGLVMYGTAIIALLYRLDFLNRLRKFLTHNTKWGFVHQWNEAHEAKKAKIKKVSGTKYQVSFLEEKEIQAEEDTSDLSLESKEGGK